MIRQTYFLLLCCFLASCNIARFNPPDEKEGIYIADVITSPTDSEAIIIRNNTGIQYDITGWNLGNFQYPKAYTISGASIPDGRSMSFPHDLIGFDIRDSGETIFLIDNTGKIVDKWAN